MRWRLKRGNDEKKLQRQMADGSLPTVQPGTVSMIDICHDSWCRIYKGRACNCDPDIRVRYSTGLSN